MTSAQAMLRRCIVASTAALAAILAGCLHRGPALTPPHVTVSPYDTEQGDVLWAVAPLRNEAGTLQADVLSMSDRLVAAVEEVEGVRAVPLNRTLEAMRALRLDEGVRTPGDARKLAQAMGVDGVLVGSLTAWEPYTPELGLSLALFARPGALADGGPTEVDPRDLTASPTGTVPRADRFADRPVSSISEHLDGKNNQVLLDVQRYAEGRADPASALNWRRYVKSMDLYQEFAAHYAVERLMQAEWSRLAGLGAQRTEQGRAPGGNPPGRLVGGTGTGTNGAER